MTERLREKMTKTVNGRDYFVTVLEYTDRLDIAHRVVIVKNPEEMGRYETGGTILKDIQKEKRGKGLKPRATHIADVINEAVSIREQEIARRDELRDEMEAVLDAADEVWSEDE